MRGCFAIVRQVKAHSHFGSCDSEAPDSDFSSFGFGSNEHSVTGNKCQPRACYGELGCAGFANVDGEQQGTNLCTPTVPAFAVTQGPGEHDSCEPDDQLVCAVFERQAEGYQWTSAGP